MRRFATVVLTLGALAITLGIRAEEPPRSRDTRHLEIDYAKIPRKIAKEPEYVASPRYALLVFGPKGDTRVWAVLDRSKPDLPYRDVLYFDRDADGDLTDPDERITSTYVERRARAGMAVVLHVGDFAVPGTDLVHRGLEFATVPKKGRKGVWFRLRWNGEHRLMCGNARVGMDSTIWAESPKDAPVLRPTPRGPLAFAIWSGHVLRRGVDSRVNVYVGSAGSGPDTHCAVDNDFLDLERDRVTLTVIAKNARGEEVRGHGRLTGRG
jgi:hypothetical protein